jgi:hypothetical protein
MTDMRKARLPIWRSRKEYQSPLLWILTPNVYWDRSEEEEQRTELKIRPKAAFVVDPPQKIPLKGEGDCVVAGGDR